MKRILLGLLLFPLVILGVDALEPKEEYTDSTIVEKEQVVESEKRWVCEDCTENEKIVLEFLQERGIEDKVALSVIMGNIKQESKFHPNICEGGARVPYHHCHRGGFGLIQWTTLGRYSGLGRFVNRHGGDPSSLNSQLQYMVSEIEWRKVEYIFKTPGLSVDKYMNTAYDWLRWGVHGKRTIYSNQYLNRLV
jgi:hypothetical protein